MTSKKVEQMVKEIQRLFNGWAFEDYWIFYNGVKRWPNGKEMPYDHRQYDPSLPEPGKHIFTMCYDGDAWECMNDVGYYEVKEAFDKILDKYGVYFEPIDSCYGTAWLV